ncbi:MAG TPA: UDP-N-acetylmuramoyl-L-alanyl-D-glutamate--2,6-diaminopimelate ligase [Phycisphaerae bacterium]|nr:UDP-N-acetylmuramoyl-L-alanyl-D-glutamate--2,6-diaminopimelate ligase [Phycisphaerae bacterium]HOJ74652.1 UDP-N-acetylmuramoyl-L-alanyl-D-glutamate--2,6-diaminopimelate ligase [Phycisphaerae bacterium]HOM50551.1 UDP-N-acetylmuramoyl-L-alanyl-D-glutamate--2,6-diaminopimelate ligase [Phycisphaerae bacterium]HON68639.1 UDP-N-acetylmuramoyl-L-alanyl-D-glutamate--2,6-diaminopimelate ligase [Phycisphaerae bacterium]HOQ84773.1 UDP-N-acetylmuramoyl-L-alanyl-D-glutamate--2,6-diaminopimelate ligase [P
MIAQGDAVQWSRLVRQAGLIDRWQGATDPLVTRIVEDSRQAGPGACFVAVRGTKVDGHQFVASAVSAGAAAIVCEQPVSVPENVAVLQVASARGVAGRLACALNGLDAVLRNKRLQLVGITGTNGKSTFCYLTQAILRAANCPTALLGTVQYDLLSRRIEASMTTPPAVDLAAYLAEAYQAGATHAVMEVSSHALDQGRCDGLHFAVGVFSNLTGDHLDYHGNMDSYLRAKKRLFDGLARDAVAAVNRDDPASSRILADCRAAVVRYGIVGGPGEKTRGSTPSACEVSARIIEQSAAGTRFELQVRPGNAANRGPLPDREQTLEFFTPLIGNHNVQNCLAAASAGLGLSLPLETILHGLESVTFVPGRLQRVPVPEERNGRGGFSVFVDYAHTDDALVNVLSALRPYANRGRLIVLFGCGGDRDRTKRPRMARAVAQWADRILLTSDNPRSEDPMQIIHDAMAGFAAADLPRVQVEPDRRKAIAIAIEMARPGDIVLLAGKGHETYQQIGSEKFPFDDAAIAAECLRGKA